MPNRSRFVLLSEKKRGDDTGMFTSSFTLTGRELIELEVGLRLTDPTSLT